MKETFDMLSLKTRRIAPIYLMILVYGLTQWLPSQQTQGPAEANASDASPMTSDRETMNTSADGERRAVESSLALIQAE